MVKQKQKDSDKQVATEDGYEDFAEEPIIKPRSNGEFRTKLISVRFTEQELAKLIEDAQAFYKAGVIESPSKSAFIQWAVNMIMADYDRLQIERLKLLEQQRLAEEQRILQEKYHEKFNNLVNNVGGVYKAVKGGIK